MIIKIVILSAIAITSSLILECGLALSNFLGQIIVGSETKYVSDFARICMFLVYFSLMSEFIDLYVRRWSLRNAIDIGQATSDCMKSRLFYAWILFFLFSSLAVDSLLSPILQLYPSDSLVSVVGLIMVGQWAYRSVVCCIVYRL